MNLPPISLVRQYDTSRLIPSRHGGETVLARIADDDSHLQDLFELDHATDDRLLAENNRVPGVAVHELVFGVPYFRIVNAAFCHPHPNGSRFNGPDRGAWYGGFETETAQAEVAYHKWLELSETRWFEETATYVEYRADFTSSFHDLRGQQDFAACLDPATYVESQRLAAALLAADSLGVVYPSVRRPGGTCVACFRPVLIVNVRQGATYRFEWSGSPTPRIQELVSVPAPARSSRVARALRGRARPGVGLPHSTPRS
ncbi:MAG: RES family NAD+ phosphorylase [Acidobacteriota bacterium]